MDVEDRKFVLKIARRLVRNRADAEDLAQDALLSAHRYKDSFDGKSKYTTWLYRVTLRTHLTKLRVAGRIKRAGQAVTWYDDLHDRLNDDEDNHQYVSFADNHKVIDSPVLARSELTEVANKVRAVGGIKEEIFWQYYAEGLTESELARIHNLKVSTIRSHLYRTKKAITRT